MRYTLDTILICLVILLIIVGVIAITMSLYDKECQQKGEMLGLDTQTKWLGYSQACLVYVQGRWIPLENYKFDPCPTERGE